MTFSPKTQRRKRHIYKLLRRLCAALLICALIYSFLQRRRLSELQHELTDAILQRYDHAHIDRNDQAKAHDHPDSALASPSETTPDTPATPRSKIAKMTMLYGPPIPMYERSLALHATHNANFGYPMYVLREPLVDGFWSKPAYIQAKLLEELAKPASERLEWLVWVDADVVILNAKVPFEAFLPSASDARFNETHLLVTNDHHGLNNGVFFIRVHPFCVDLMANVLAMRHYRPNIVLKYTDQSALAILIERTPSNALHTIHVPQRWFNAFPGDRTNGINNPSVRYKANSVLEGDILVHFAGNKKTRRERMTPWMDVAERRLAQWEFEYDMTTLPKETAKFWREEAGLELERAQRRVEKERRAREKAEKEKADGKVPVKGKVSKAQAKKGKDGVQKGSEKAGLQVGIAKDQAQNEASPNQAARGVKKRGAQKKQDKPLKAKPLRV